MTVSDWIILFFHWAVAATCLVPFVNRFPSMKFCMIKISVYTDVVSTTRRRRFLKYRQLYSSGLLHIDMPAVLQTALSRNTIAVQQVNRSADNMHTRPRGRGLRQMTLEKQIMAEPEFVLSADLTKAFRNQNISSSSFFFSTAKKIRDPSSHLLSCFSVGFSLLFFLRQSFYVAYFFAVGSRDGKKVSYEMTAQKCSFFLSGFQYFPPTYTLYSQSSHGRKKLFDPKRN